MTTSDRTDEDDGTNENEILTPPQKNSGIIHSIISFIDIEYKKYGMKKSKYETDSKTGARSV